MSKKTNKKTESPEVENPQVEEPQIEQPETEQPEAEPEDNRPSYVKELLEKGVVVIQGRSRGELDEKLATIPSNINFYTGAVGYYIDKSLYRIQVNIKED
jgi:hypothetical protein